MNDIKKDKAKLEKYITRLIQEFEIAHGVYVSNIDVWTTGDARGKRTSIVTLEVRL